ncbi:hypothetical protein, partial [uncultured Jannaschia sp.]|uniref:hypothetical protein n=1 Tax=uncultured Jannaschia sp. TaxID=293347 RepID=UPI0026116F78
TPGGVIQADFHLTKARTLFRQTEPLLRSTSVPMAKPLLEQDEIALPCVDAPDARVSLDGSNV